MLYVFQMDIGQMLTFDMSLLMDTVARLQAEIYKATGISVDQQILLLSGGQSLKSDQKVMAYGAGADTNPVFLFSKLAIESQEPPIIRSFVSSKDALISVKERVTDAVKMRPSYDTVNIRAKLAIQIRDSANSIYTYCKNEFQEQHLQHQGWGAVIANLEEIADALQKTEIKFTKVFHGFFSSKVAHLKTVGGFTEVLDLISRIPLLDSLKESSEDCIESKFKGSDRSLVSSLHAVPNTLFEWISSQAQGQGIDCLHQKCEEDLKVFNECMFESYGKQVQDLLSVVRMDPNQMKELVGIERRLSELEKRLNEAKRIATTQNELAQGFMKHQSKLGSLPDVSSILPDLCETHKQQLVQMLDCQQRIFALQNNFRNSKQEMSRNIHQRLGWVMHVETKIAKLDSELIFHIKALKVLECNVDLLSQIKTSPFVYAELVIETARRRKFSDKYSQWAEALEEGSNRLYEAETERRKNFSQKHGEHFLLHTVFKGFEDKPSDLTTKVPRLYDANLPEITDDEISLLKSSVPELEDSLSLFEPSDKFPSDLLCTYSSDKNLFNAKQATTPLLNVQISQSHAMPCVVTAREGPAKPFNLPEFHDSQNPCHHHVLSNVSDTARKDVATGTPVMNVVDKSSQEESHVKVAKETQTCVSVLSKGFGTAEVSESDSAKLVSGKPTSATDSTSPISSTEFATADFYFEESMPSPMAESSSDKKTDDQTKSEMKEDLNNELKEKGMMIEELNSLLRQKEEETLKLLNEVRTLKGENSEENLEFFSLIGPLEEADNDRREIPSPVAEAKGVESAWCQTESSTSVDEKVKSLEQKMAKLTFDLDHSQVSLLKAEENLKAIQKQEEAIHEKDGSSISKLEDEVVKSNAILEETKDDLDLKEKELVRLKDNLKVSCEQNGELKKELGIRKETLKALQSKLKESVSVSLKMVLSLKHDLNCLKIFVKENMNQLDEFKISSNTSLEKAMLSFKIILSGLEQERDSLKTDIHKLEDEMTRMKNEKEEVNDLKAQLNSAQVQLSKQEEIFGFKYLEQKNDFDCALQDIETKHALEMELELDKCKADMKDCISEWERKYDDEKDSNYRILEDLENVREDFVKEKKELLQSHQEAIIELERKYKEGNEACVSDLEEQIYDYRNQIQTLETEAVATASAIDKEKEDSLEALRVQLMKEKEDSLQDMAQKNKEQVLEFQETIQKEQLKYDDKLAELKKSFNKERETLQTKLKKYMESEMINSQTQTELELLAEVISLTSSASDGMEELMSLKPTDEDTTGKQKTPANSEEELLKQLEEAHETIKSLEEKVKVSKTENEQLMEKQRSQESRTTLTQTEPGEEEESRYQSLMQTSAIGKSFILMDNDKQLDQSGPESDEMKLKDQKIAQLEKHIMEMSMTTSTGKTQNPDKISFRGCDIGDLVLLCLDEKHDQYVVFTVGTNLHFLHSESLDSLGLKSVAEPANKKPWILAKVMDKEYCLAKKPNNRFRVPQGTCFYRVKCQPWKCEVDLTRHKDMDTVKQKVTKSDQGSVNKTKKSEKK